MQRFHTRIPGQPQNPCRAHVGILSEDILSLPEGSHSVSDASTMQEDTASSCRAGTKAGVLQRPREEGARGGTRP